MKRFLTAALYRFVELPDAATLKRPLLLAQEGVNAIAGVETGVRMVLA